MSLSYWRSEYNGKVYAANNEVLVGLGNPPGCPDYQHENPGLGQMPMEQITRAQFQAARKKEKANADDGVQ